jgi:hypothetical protein
MSLPEPFAYPDRPHRRRHGPRGYQEYGGFKEWLRDEFAFRCVYCLERERWDRGPAGSFSVDHLVPQSVDSARVCNYDNLAYACTRCNSHRRDVAVLDPIQTAFGEHLRVDEQGAIHALTPEGQDLIDQLYLDIDPALGVRQGVLAILALKRAWPDDLEVHRVFEGMFKYPEDLPNLHRLRPPAGNTRPEGINNSHHARRARGELSEVY